jgi:hypothetical protein
MIGCCVVTVSEGLHTPQVHHPQSNPSQVLSEKIHMSEKADRALLTFNLGGAQATGFCCLATIVCCL